MSPTKLGTDKVAGALTKWFTGMRNMDPGKKLYSLLWFITGIFLVVEIAIQIAWSGNSTKAEADAIAGVLIALIVSMFGAIVTTVIVSIRLRKVKKTTDKGGKK